MVLGVAVVSFLLALFMVYMEQRAGASAKNKQPGSVDMTPIWTVAAVGCGFAAVLSFCGWLWMTISGTPV